MRELCSGVNVDLGTAAAFREQWSREAGSRHSSTKPIPLVLKTNQAPGDAVAMTAAIYSLHRAHPGKYVTGVESPFVEVFMHNPDIEHSVDGRWSVNLCFANIVEMHYPAIHQSNERGIHFMQGWCEFLGSALGVSVPLLTNKPRLYFTDPDPPVGNFWLVCSGGKHDFTTKLWGHRNYQEVVDRLAGIEFVQVGSSEHEHPRLRGAVDVVGKTSLRELFDLARRARGILCGVSLLMHVAAALEKPAVVVAGGREPVAWNAYPKQRYLHTVGALPCRDAQGRTGGACWRYRTIPLGDSAILDKNTCEYPIDGTPKCMTLISPEYVAETIVQTERR